MLEEHTIEGFEPQTWGRRWAGGLAAASRGNQSGKPGQSCHGPAQSSEWCWAGGVYQEVPGAETGLGGREDRALLERGLGLGGPLSPSVSQIMTRTVLRIRRKRGATSPSRSRMMSGQEGVVVGTGSGPRPQRPLSFLGPCCRVAASPGASAASQAPRTSLALGMTNWALPPRRVILILEHHAAFN